MTQFLQIAVALIFFTNKVFVLIDKRAGWLIGAIAATISIFYFFLIKLYIFTALEFGLIVLMGYGFFHRKERSEKVERILHVTIILVMVALTYFVFNGLMTSVEFVASILMLTGSYYLTHARIQLGWTLYGLAHIFSAIVGYHANQHFFADFQIASGIIAIAGLAKASIKKPL